MLYMFGLTVITERDVESISRKLLSDEMLSEMPFIHIECIIQKQKWTEVFSNRTGTLEDHWILIQTLPISDRNVEILANEFYNGIAQEVIHQVIPIVPSVVQLKTLRKLAGKFALKKIKRPESRGGLKRLLKAKLRPVDSVVVSNVGQGNLNFLTTGKTPSVYFDLGGGAGIHSATYATTKVTCKSIDPLVILSHWDMDHLETAIRDSSNSSLNWVVPDQPVGKTHFSLAIRI